MLKLFTKKDERCLNLNQLEEINKHLRKKWLELLDDIVVHPSDAIILLRIILELTWKIDKQNLNYIRKVMKKMKVEKEWETKK